MSKKTPPKVHVQSTLETPVAHESNNSKLQRAGTIIRLARQISR
jgi:hypothetical protein